MNILIGICLAYLLITLVIVPISLLGVWVLSWIGDRVEDFLVATEEWQKRKGWW